MRVTLHLASRQAECDGVGGRGPFFFEEFVDDLTFFRDELYSSLLLKSYNNLYGVVTI